MIEPADFDFYKKISVPPPTWCPRCRLQRRLAFLNLFHLYKRPCGLCKKDFISIFRPDSPYVVYCPRCWWSDEWSPFQYGADYDFSRTFFEQFRDLWLRTPVLGISIDPPTLESSPYTSHAGHLKNCYLLFHADSTEDSAYGFDVDHCRSVFDCGPVMSSELCYDSMHSYKNNRCVGLRSQVTESIECAFLKDCMNCQNCFASANLRGKKYHIFNKPYSKEEYFNEMKKWDLGSYRSYMEAKKRAEEHWRTMPPKPTMDEFTTNCSGRNVFQSKNCQQCFEVVGAEDSKYLLLTPMAPIKDSYDVSSWGDNMSRCYECSNVGEFVSDLRFCNESGIELYYAEYSKLSTGGRNHFGCVSVKKGEYCILNKRYGKGEYEALRAKIIEHMNSNPYTDKKGRTYRYGEFFPAEFSPFAYNETIAASFFPLSEQETLASGYRWQAIEQAGHAVTLKSADLPDHINDAPDRILEEIIGCEKCGRGFKIIKMELDFLRRMHLPLPRRCPFCRVEEKFSQWVDNLRVFKRTCSKCAAEFETNYPKEEAEYILCKRCYLAEIT